MDDNNDTSINTVLNRCNELQIGHINEIVV